MYKGAIRGGQIGNPSLVALTLIVASGLAVWTLKPPEPRPVSRFDYDLPEGHQLGAMGFGTLALSPDSRYFVYSTLDGVYLRSMTELDARLISGSEGTVNSPYFSPDGEWVAYIGPIGLKGKSAIRIHREYLGRQRNFTGYHLWARGYCVSTVGVAEEVIRDYIRQQEADEKKQEKLELG